MRSNIDVIIIISVNFYVHSKIAFLIKFWKNPWKVKGPNVFSFFIKLDGRSKSVTHLHIKNAIKVVDDHMAVLHASALVAAHSVCSHGGELVRRRRDEQLRGLVEADAQGVHPSDACLHQPQLRELCNQKPKVQAFGTTHTYYETRLEEGRVPKDRRQALFATSA